MDFSRSQTFGYSWSHQDIYNQTVFVELDQRLDNDWRLHLGASKNGSEFKMMGGVLERDYEISARRLNYLAYFFSDQRLDSSLVRPRRENCGARDRLSDCAPIDRQHTSRPTSSMPGQSQAALDLPSHQAQGISGCDPRTAGHWATQYPCRLHFL